MPIIVVPKPLREKLGEEAVDSLVELLNQFEDKTKGDVIALSEEKFERRLSEEISKVRVELSEKISEEISKVRIELSALKEEITGVRNGLKAEMVALEEKFERRLSEEISKVRVELSTLKSDLIKWMFIFWVGQIGTILGILFAFFR